MSVATDRGAKRFVGSSSRPPDVVTKEPCLKWSQAACGSKSRAAPRAWRYPRRYGAGGRVRYSPAARFVRWFRGTPVMSASFLTLKPLFLSFSFRNAAKSAEVSMAGMIKAPQLYGHRGPHSRAPCVRGDSPRYNRMPQPLGRVVTGFTRPQAAFRQ